MSEPPPETGLAASAARFAAGISLEELQERFPDVTFPAPGTREAGVVVGLARGNVAAAVSYARGTARRAEVMRGVLDTE